METAPTSKQSGKERNMEELTASTSALQEPLQKEDKGMETAPTSKQSGKERNMEEVTASTAAQQEVRGPLQKEDKGKETAPTSKQEAKERNMEVATASMAAQLYVGEVGEQQERMEIAPKSKQEMDEAPQMVEPVSDDTDTEDEEEAADEEEEAAARWKDGLGEPLPRWNNGKAAELGNGGLILVLVQINNGFAIFMYDGIKLFEKDALQNIWVDFADHTVAKRTAWLVEFCTSHFKDSAINADGVSVELAKMIRNNIEPEQKLAVEKKVYQEVIQSKMEISCLYSEAVEELIWGLRVQMPYYLTEGEPTLDEKETFLPSKGMKLLLNTHDLPEDTRVTRHIIYLAGVVRECDRCVQKHDYSLRSAAEHLKIISQINTEEWDLMVLATALKMICCPGEKIAAAPLLFPKCVLVKLKEDAPKYKGKILKKPLLIMYKEMYLARCTRSRVLRKLCYLMGQREQLQEAINQLTNVNESLRVECNKRQNPPTLAPADVLGRYTCISSHLLHRTNEPGILSMHIHPSKDVVATGGIDTNAVLFDWPSRQVLCTLIGHSKKITTLKFVNGDELFITGSADKTVRIWHGSEYGNCMHIDHTAEVVAVAVQAGEKCFVSASKDNWRLYDISTVSCLKVVEASELEDYTSASFHPHGLLLGTGTISGVVKLWDMKTKSELVDLMGHVGPVTAMSFSGNGYLLATTALDGVRLWDVRKLHRSICTICPYRRGTPTNAVEFDSSGSYLGIGGSDARVYQVDKAEWIKTLPDLSGTGKVTSLKFGADTKYIAVGSMDCNLRIFGLPREQMEF